MFLNVFGGSEAAGEGLGGVVSQLLVSVCGA